MTKLLIYALIFVGWIVIESLTKKGAKGKKPARRPQPAARPASTGSGGEQDALQDIFRRLAKPPKTPDGRKASPAPAAAPPPPPQAEPARLVKKDERKTGSEEMRKEVDRQRGGSGKRRKRMAAPPARTSSSTSPLGESTSGHADRLGRDAESHAEREWGLEEHDLDQVDEHLATHGWEDENAPTAHHVAGSSLDLSRKSLINALILGEVIGRRGGLGQNPD